MEPLTFREKYLNREMTIDSTSYYEGEFLDIGKSVCVGVTADGKEFKFNSSRNGNHLNLGCVYTRPRSRVFLDYQTLKDLFYKNAEKWSEKRKKPIPTNIAVVYYKNSGRISVGEYQWVADKFNDQFKFQSSNLRLSFSITEPRSVVQTSYATVWMFDDIEQAIMKVAELINIEVPEETSSELDLKKEAAITEIDKQISVVKEQLRILEAKRIALISK